MDNELTNGLVNTGEVADVGAQEPTPVQETPTPTDNNAVEPTQEPVQTQSNENSGAPIEVDNNKIVATAETSRGTVLQVVVNPDTGRRELKEVPVNSATTEPNSNVESDKSHLDTNTQTENKQAQNQNMEAPPTVKQPQPYSESELTLAIQMGTPVDETRLTPKMAVAYGAYKQRLAQQQAIERAKQEQSQQPQANTDEAKAEAENRAKFYQKVDAMAKENAMKELGLSQDDIDASEYSDDEELIHKVEMYRTAQDYHRQRILNYVEVEEQKAAQASNVQKAIYQDISNFAANAQKTEPRFNEINVALQTYYHTLPYEKAKKYAEAVGAYKNGNINAQQTQALQEYYEETRKYIYGKANNLSSVPKKSVPPVVEKAGSGAAVPRTINYNELRNISVRDREAWIRNNL